MKIHTMEQGTDEWFAVRNGKMTASHAQAIGSCGKGLETYCWQVVAESLSSGEKEFYTNKDMERGNELEAQAISMYELEKGVETEIVGFVEHNEYVGASPDRLVGEDGMVEVKCPNDINFFKGLVEKKIDSKYEWQMQMQMFVTGRKWCDFVAYNPNFENSLFIMRVNLDPEKQEKLKQGIALGTEKIKAIQAKYNA